MNPHPETSSPRPADIYLFGTCVLDLFDPDAGVAAVQLIERAGIRVHYPQDQTCCGQPAYTSGFPAEARSVAARQLALFTEDWPIVVPSGSCAGMMHHHWPRLFTEDPVLRPRAAVIASRVIEFTAFVHEVLKLDWPVQPAERVVLHTSCSARREMGTHRVARELLSAMPGVTLLEQDHEAECCGFGGTFSVKHPEISAAMASDKCDALQATGASALVSADGACLLNINGTLQKRDAKLKGQHIASFLWQRSGGKP
jgi:L-lactate dehydrogenase complex protein LldE